MGGGFGRLLLQTGGFTLRVKRNHAITFRVPHLICKDGSTGISFSSAFQILRQPMAVENVISQHQGNRVLTQKVSSNDKGLCNPLGLRLDRILDFQPPLSSVGKQKPKAFLVLRSGDHKNLPDSCQHQGRQRIVDHGFVVDRHELLAHGKSQRIETSAGATRQNDPFSHLSLSTLRPSLSPRYLPCCTRRHHSWFSKYQRTVFASPWSKPCLGFQPSSLRTFSASIA